MNTFVYIGMAAIYIFGWWSHKEKESIKSKIKLFIDSVSKSSKTNK